MAAHRDQERIAAVSDITEILQRVTAVDRTAVDGLTPLVCQQLRQIAQRQLTAENDARRWDATELVHEAYLRLIGESPVTWQDRALFFATASTSRRTAMRVGTWSTVGASSCTTLQHG